MARLVTCDFNNDTDSESIGGDHKADFICNAKHGKRPNGKGALEVSTFKTVDCCVAHLPNAFSKLKDAIRNENFISVEVVKAQ